MLLEPGARLDWELSAQAHAAVALLQAQKAALDSGIPLEELASYTWRVSVRPLDASTGEPCIFVF